MASFNDAWQSLQMAFSGDRIQTREGMRRNSWLGPIVNQVRGLRQNYLMNHPRLSPSLQRIESSPPGNLRRRTRRVRPRVFTFGTTPIPVIEFDKNPIIPGLEFSNSLLAFVVPLRFLWNLKRFIFMLRVWFRRAMRNARNRPPLPDRRVRPRLTYNPALD